MFFSFTVIDIHELSQNPFSPDVDKSELEDSPVTKTIVSGNNNQLQERASLSKRYRFLIGGLILCTIAAIAASTIHPNCETTTSFDLLDLSLRLPSLLDHLDYNPHGGDSPYDFSLWNTGRGCNGIEINIVHNLEDKWKPYLQAAVADWDDGEPDAITVRVHDISTYDPDCTPVRDLIKVCNGDYGNTDWVGTNVAIVVNGFISSSVAKMNDYHLDKMKDGAKQWTMCHELGHGFGLGRWDERFYNRDLGNCMDYTSRPERNQKPDTSNFLFLEKMYGNVNGTSQYSAMSVENGTEKLHCSSGELFATRSLTVAESSSEEDYFARYIQFIPSNHTVNMDTESNEHPPQADQGWACLSRTRHREVRELEVEDGMKIVTTFHLVKQML